MIIIIIPSFNYSTVTRLFQAMDNVSVGGVCVTRDIPLTTVAVLHLTKHVLLVLER